MKTLVFSPQDGFSVCSPSQHSRHYWTGLQLLHGKPGVAAGAALQRRAVARACTVSIVPDALLMRQLTVLAWTGMHRVGDAQGAPTAAPQQPQTVLSASTPRPTWYGQPPCQGRNTLALGQSRSFQGGNSSSYRVLGWGLRSAFLYPSPGDDALSPLRRPQLLEDTACHLPKAGLQPHCSHTVGPPIFSVLGISDWGCKSKNHSAAPQAWLHAL